MLSTMDRITFEAGAAATRPTLVPAFVIALALCQSLAQPASSPLWLLVCCSVASVAAFAGSLWLAKERRLGIATRYASKLCLGVVGALWVWTYQQPQRPLSVESLRGEGVLEAVGQVKSGERRKLEVLLLEGDDGIASQEGKRFELELPPELELAHGDRISASLHLRLARAPLTPGAFDERAHFERKALSGRISLRSAAQRLEPRRDAWTQLRRAMDEHRQAAARLLQNHGRGALSALALGEGQVDPEMRRCFSITGVAHVLAVSGLHFGLVALMLQFSLCRLFGRSAFLCRRIGARRLASLLAIPLLAIYVVYVGAPVSARRAFVMATCLLAGRALRREGDSMGFLGIAACVILAWRPQELTGVGFQLSFSAVLGLLWSHRNLHQSLQRWALSRRPRVFAKSLSCLFGALVPTLGASVATAPFVIHHFGAVPVLGVLANLWVIPVVAYLLLPMALAAAALSTTWLGAASVLAQAAAAIEELLFESVLWASALPGVALPVSTPSVFFCVALAGLAVALLRLVEGRRFVVLAVLSLVSLVLLGVFSRAGVERLTITMLAVGQGDAILVEFPNGQAMLVDGGGELGRSSADPGKQVILPYLRSLGRERLDWVVLTHADYDHLGGLISVFEEMPVGQLWTSDEAMDGVTAQRLLTLVQRQGVVRRLVWAGDELEVGGVRVRVLWPHRKDDEEEFGRNDRSVVLRLDYGWFSCLLTGDIGERGERALLDENVESVRTVSLLKAAHHGSSSSTSEAFLDASQPQWMTYSVGRRNRYGFPHAQSQMRAVARRLATWRTDEGSIQVQSDGRRMRLAQYLP